MTKYDLLICWLTPQVKTNMCVSKDPIRCQLILHSLTPRSISGIIFIQGASQVLDHLLLNVDIVWADKVATLMPVGSAKLPALMSTKDKSTRCLTTLYRMNKKSGCQCPQKIFPLSNPVPNAHIKE